MADRHRGRAAACVSPDWRRSAVFCVEPDLEAAQPVRRRLQYAQRPPCARRAVRVVHYNAKSDVGSGSAAARLPPAKGAAHRWTPCPPVST
eukprot:365906-Chlamydomonas_euryale.AAC.22